MQDQQTSVIRQQRQIGDAIVLTLAGDVDLNSSPNLRKELLAAAELKPRRLVLNLAGVSYMDSSGVASLVEALRRLQRSGGKLVLCSLSIRVKSILELARLDKVFAIAPNEEEALA